MKRMQNSDNAHTSLKKGFWKQIDEKIVTSVLPYQWKALNDEIEGAEESHCVENFRIAAGESTESYGGMVFQDSDLAKWLEAAAYSLQHHPDPALETRMDEVIALMGRAQREDGYLNTYFICTDLSKRWTNLMEAHELYCAGHLMEASVAYFETTGKRTLLTMMLKLARHIADVFGPEQGQKKGYPGHPEIELALMRMYETTGEDFLFDLAKFFIDQRGTAPDYFTLEQEQYHSHGLHTDPAQRKPTYDQHHAPIRQQETMEGHSVRGLYLLSGMIDLGIESGDQRLMDASKRLFQNVISRRMYVTGSVGSTMHGEAFTMDYDLPNNTAYAETCASIALIFAAHRLFLAEPKGLYGDVIERALYNTCMAGMSADGNRFFYVNPLEVDPEKCVKNPDLSHVLPERPKWFGCACCPPNLARLITSLGKYIYAIDENNIYVNLYIASTTEVTVGKQRVCLDLDTQYPAEGRVRLTVSEGCYGLRLRLPEWEDAYQLRINGEAVSCSANDGFLCLHGEWRTGDVVEFQMDMPPRRVYANPRVSADTGKVAIQRGPLVYCTEEADNEKELHRLRLPRSGTIEMESREDISPGVVGIVAQGQRLTEDWNELYRQDAELRYEPCPIHLIPYYLWANRSLGEMTVWLREA